jgi:hypothetical protein
MERAGAAVLLDVYECANEPRLAAWLKRVFEAMLASHGDADGG